MTIRETYLNMSEQQITEFLANFYSGTPEGDLISRLIASAKTLIELPIDFEPLHHFGRRDSEGWEDKLSKFDYITLYHGTSTQFQEEIEKEGLRPRMMTGNSNFVGKLESQIDSVYLGQLNYFGNAFDSVKKHAQTVAKKMGGLPLIIRAIIPLIDCLPDEDVNYVINGNQSLIYGGTTRIKGIINPEVLFMHPQSEETLDDAYRTRIRQFMFYDVHRALSSPSPSNN